MRWNGMLTETEPDLFSRKPDFEGYRIYMSRSGQADDWSFLTQRDLFNYGRHTWNRADQRWELKDRPLTVDSLKSLYDAYTLNRYGFEFHPDSFRTADLDKALLEIVCDPDHPDQVDSLYRYFAAYEANNVPDDRALRVPSRWVWTLRA